MEIDYAKIGLKVGLEVHQQLNTSHKLFCHCEPKLSKEVPTNVFLRGLRPTQSELGQVDPAAYFEFQKGVRILYEADRETSCLVEMDEEPPHAMNMEAIEIALTVAVMMKSKPVDEIHVMRKTVIDGSNTTGFQRTCVVALNGEINVDKPVPIQHIGLEEDAARKTGEEGNIIHYRIDRLGIPLMEIATAPVIKSPSEAEEVALEIGSILRATGKVIRGLGAIRQDINVSIANGALVEIKGVQELGLVSRVLEYEVQRQLNLITISKELREIGLKQEHIGKEFQDVRDVFKQTKCKVIREALEKKYMVLAAKLSKFKGFLKRELMPGSRLGTEMADRARFWGRVGGIFHTDELPAYGITNEEVEQLREAVGAEEKDAVVFVAGTAENARDSLEAVSERAREAISGVPDETRGAKPDGTTYFMRPRPGAARMYPETDIPPIEVTEECLKQISQCLPELPRQKIERLIKEHKLNQKLAKQILNSKYGELYEIVVEESNVSPVTVAVFMTETLKALKREGIRIERVSEARIREIFKFLGEGRLIKEAIPGLVILLSKKEDISLQEAIKELDLRTLSENELRTFVKQVIDDNHELIRKRGGNSFSVLMGIVMKRVRGKTDAALVSRLLKEKLKEHGV